MVRVKGSLLIDNLEFTHGFLEKVSSKSPREAFPNIYFDFIKNVLSKHKDVVSKGNSGKGCLELYRHFSKGDLFKEDYLPLIYQEFHSGNINSYVEILRKKYSYKEGRLVFLADCNNHRELVTCLKEIKICHLRKKRGALANSDKSIARIFSSEGKIEII